VAATKVLLVPGVGGRPCTAGDRDHGESGRELAAMGICFAVDDFGTGYASLQHLQRLPIATLKIDRSFIQRLCESSRSYPIVKAIIELAHSLRMQVIAEGVEDEDQLLLLRELKCDCIQGFLLSLPLPPEDIEDLLRN
jgi:EAL domain-containing protein (putative c-di-GMP-specific phosphodiesterase class I)